MRRVCLHKRQHGADPSPETSFVEQCRNLRKAPGGHIDQKKLRITDSTMRKLWIRRGRCRYLATAAAEHIIRSCLLISSDQFDVGVVGGGRGGGRRRAGGGGGGRAGGGRK